jgi:hypothetical protein
MKINVFKIYILISFQSMLLAQSSNPFANVVVEPSLFYNAISSEFIDNLNQSVFLGYDKSIPAKDSINMFSLNIRCGPTVSATKSDKSDMESIAQQLLLPSNLSLAVMGYGNWYLDETKQYSFQILFDFEYAASRVKTPNEVDEKKTLYFNAIKVAIGVKILNYLALLISYRGCDYGKLNTKTVFSDIFQTENTWSNEILYGISFYLESYKTNLYVDFRKFLGGAIYNKGISSGVISFGISKDIKLSSLLGSFE